jgi:hypothetical protein
MADLVPAIMLVGSFTIVFLALRTLSDNRTRRKLAETRAGLHRDLIGRFGSAEELIGYLGSDAGRELLSGTQPETPNPVRRILAAIQSGLILVAVGIACLFLGNTSGYGSDGRVGFTFLGAMAFSIGLGFLASAGASWALSKRWGLIEQEPRQLERRHATEDAGA